MIPITESRFFLRTGAIAVRGGLSEDNALQSPDDATAPRCCTWRIASARSTRARMPISSSCPARRSASTPRCWKPTSTARRSSTAACTRIGPIRPAASRWPKNKQLLAGDVRSDQAAARGQTPTACRRRTQPHRCAKEAGRAGGRIHTVGKGTIIDGIILVETARSPRSARARISAAEGLAGGDRRCGDAGADRRPFGGRPVRGAQLQEGRSGSGRDERSQPGRSARAGQLLSEEPLLQFVREQGVTVVHAMPGRRTSSRDRPASSAPMAEPPSR